MIKLRYYQERAMTAVLKSYDRDVKKVAIVMGVGTGKTITFCAIAKAMMERTGKKTLILAHREELLTQAQEDLGLVDPSITSTIEQGNNEADMRAQVIIASVPTLGRSSSKRIAKFNPDDFCCIITDEAHHATSKTYTNIFNHFGCLKDKNDNNRLLLLGVTATGFRSDNQGLDEIFDDIPYEYNMVTAIKQKFLTNLKAYTVKTNIDISHIKRTAGDFNLKELGEAINQDERNAIVLDTYKKHCTKTQTIVFCVGIDHAKTLTKIFQNEGIKAAYVIGSTPKKERKQTVVDFKAGEINVIMNVGVFTEGTNIPNIQSIIMARPTQSLGLYIQIIGRSTRLYEGKDFAHIYDIVDNAGKQGIKTMASILGVDGNLDFQGKDLIEIKDFVDKLRNLSPNIIWDKVDVNDPKGEIKRLDLISGLQVPPELSPFTEFAWSKLSADQYKVNLGKDRDQNFGFNMYLRQDALGKFDVFMSTFRKADRTTKWVRVEHGLPLTEAIKVADTKINTEFSDKRGLIDRTAPWRAQKPTDKQLQMLTKLGVKEDVCSQIDKGQASFLLDKLFEERPKKVLTQKQKNYLKWKKKF